MRRSSRSRYLAIRRRFYRRLFALIVLITIISVVIFVKCSKDYIFTICIDPGHGGYDSGAVNEAYGVNEKDLNLDVSLKIGKILKKQDVKVIYTRKKDKVPWKTQRESLEGRSKISNKSDVDIFLSIHANNFDKSSKVKGTEVWLRFKNTEDEILATYINDNLTNIGYTRDRGLRYESDKGLYVLRNTQATSVLVELGYLSNKDDIEFLMSEDGKDKVAKAIADAIMEYYSKNNDQDKS